MLFPLWLPAGCFLVLDSRCLNSDLPFPTVSLWASCPILLSVRAKWNNKSNFLIGLGRLNGMKAPKLLTQYLVYSYHYAIIIQGW